MCARKSEKFPYLLLAVLLVPMAEPGEVEDERAFRDLGAFFPILASVDLCALGV